MMMMMILREFDKANKALYEQNIHCSVIYGKMGETGSNLMAQSRELVDNILYQTHVFSLET